MKDFTRLHQGDTFLTLNRASNRNGIHAAWSLLLINPQGNSVSLSYLVSFQSLQNGDRTLPLWRILIKVSSGEGSDVLRLKC